MPSPPTTVSFLVSAEVLPKRQSSEPQLAKALDYTVVATFDKLPNHNTSDRQFLFQATKHDLNTIS